MPALAPHRKANWERDMRLRSALAMACLAMFMLGWASAASAALPTFLVETGSLPVKFEGSAGLTRIKTTGSFTVECKNTKVSGEVTSTHAGTYKFDIEGCVAPGGLTDCHTSGDPKGVLLWSGEFHFVRIALSPVKAAMLMSIPTLSSSCAGEFATHESKGFVLPITPINTFGKSFTLTAASAGVGVQEFTSYYNEAGTLVTGAYLQLSSGPTQFALESSISLTMERKSEIQA
jgi:hypothetical protein